MIAIHVTSWNFNFSWFFRVFTGLIDTKIEAEKENTRNDTITKLLIAYDKVTISHNNPTKFNSNKELINHFAISKSTLLQKQN